MLSDKPFEGTIKMCRTHAKSLEGNTKDNTETLLRRDSTLTLLRIHKGDTVRENTDNEERVKNNSVELDSEGD